MTRRYYMINNNACTITLRYSSSLTKVSLQLNSGPFLSYLTTVLIALLLLLLSCTGTQKKKSVLPYEQSLSSLFVDKLDRFEGTGNVEVSFKGERYRGKVLVLINNRDNFVCDFYDPFAHLVASLTSDKDSAKITIGENEYRIAINDNVSFIPYLTQYPFIFSDFIRIITGRVYKREYFSLDADSINEERRRKVYKWISDSLTLSVVASSSGKKIKRVVYTALKDFKWTLEYSSFENGISRKINFESGEKNYFSLEFDTIRL